jgi:acyl dehydratase
MYDWDRKVDWSKQLYFEKVEVGSEVPPVSIPLDLQQMVMEAGANRDFSSIHHDRDLAQASGAPDAFASTSFVIGMFERTLREWMGLQGSIRKLGPFRMTLFMSVGDVVTFKATVKDKHKEDSKGIIDLDILAETPKGQTVKGTASVILPTKE